jgi:hypothetical protein
MDCVLIKKKKKKKKEKPRNQTDYVSHKFIAKANKKNKYEMWSSGDGGGETQDTYEDLYFDDGHKQKVGHLRRPVGTLPPVPITFPTSAWFSEVGG